MTTFLVNIWAYDHYAKFSVKCDNSSTSLEKAILDKLGEKSIVWEYLGISYDNKINRITYEEVINDASTSAGPIQAKEGSGPRMGAGAS